MADTTVSRATRVQSWADKEFYSYVRANLFKPYMGKGENSIIQVKRELQKEAGDRITFSLVADPVFGPGDRHYKHRAEGYGVSHRQSRGGKCHLSERQTSQENRR